MTGSREELPALDRLRRRDEILQLLYWMEGEGFERDMTGLQIRRFVGLSEAEVAAGLRDLSEAGLAAPAEGRWCLTEAGRREGGRRFVEEFAPILSRSAHAGECHDPDCVCHDESAGAAACPGGHGAD